MPEEHGDLGESGSHLTGGLPVLGSQVGNYNIQNNIYYLPAVGPIAWPIHLGIFPQLADCYQERSEADQLRVAISAGGPAATHVLSGLGGVGKSQLAAALVAERVDEFDLIAWIDAQSRESITAAYSNAAQRLGCRTAKNDAEAAQWFVNWLQTSTDRSWLIVLDDLSDPADLRSLWPTGPRGVTIITTPRTDAALSSTGRMRVEVGLFTPSQAAHYIFGRLRAEPGSPLLREVEQLVQDLEFFPLALAQAAAFMVDRGETCAGYRLRFAGYRRRLADLFPPDALADDYARTIATTWSISVEAADQLPPAGAGRRVLEVAGMLNAGEIPGKIFRQPQTIQYVMRTLITANESDEVSRVVVQDALHNLSRFSLVSVTPPQGEFATVRVHSLVQRATIERIADDRMHELTWAIADGIRDLWAETPPYSEMAEALRANSVSLLQKSGVHLFQPRQHPVLWHAGQSFGRSGLVFDAVSYWSELCRICGDVRGSEDPDTLTDRHQLALWKNAAGYVDEAIEDLQVLLEEDVRIFGAKHPETLTTRHSLGTYKGESGHYTEAVRELEGVLADRVEVLGADNPDTMATRGNIARFRGESGDPYVAVKEFDQLLKDRTRVFGARHEETLHTRGNLAYWQGKTGNAYQAAAEFMRLAKVRAEVLGEAHPATLDARHDAANWQGQAGNPAGAAEAYRKLVLDKERILGAMHPDTVAARGCHADWLGEAGDTEQAIGLLQDVVEDIRVALGPRHPDTFANRNNLAYWKAKSGDPQGAIAVYEELRADILESHGEDNPALLAVRSNLAGCYGEAGDAGRAVADFRLILADRRRLLHPDHPLVRRTEENLRRWQAVVAARS